MKEAIRSVEGCIVEASDSFLYEKSYPPTTTEQLNASCKRKTEAFKCIKDKLKSGVPGLAKRGLLSYVQGRQKYQKKYCTDVNSEQSKTYLRDMSCLMKHKFQRFKELDNLLCTKAMAIEKRNYNDSAPELKQICCALYTHKRNMLASIGPECAASREKIEELVLETVTEDLSLVCDDEEKMITKVCPTIDKLDLSKRFDPKTDANSAGTFIYLVTTLGEPEATK